MAVCQGAGQGRVNSGEREGRTGQRGSMSVELAILLPAFLLLIVLAIMVGRVAVAHHAITVAAHDAARAASLSRDAAAAQQQAETAVLDTLAHQGLSCGRLELDTTDLSEQFARPVGQPASATVTVGCEVVLTDVAILGMTSSRWVEATFTSPLDTWRFRS